MYDFELFAQLSDAEDFFNFFDLPWDARVIDRHRVALLRAWAGAIQRIDVAHRGASAEERLWLYRESLAELHEAFATGQGPWRLATPETPCSGCGLQRVA